MRNPTPRRSILLRVTFLLAMLAVALDGSPSLLAQAAATSKQLGAQERKKLETQASALIQAGLRASQKGDLMTALAKTRESLQIREQLYPKEDYPEGQTEVADSLHAMGFLLRAQGSYGEARGYHERALGMYELLYPKDRYPEGHTYLARSLSAMGSLLCDQCSYGESQGYFQRALAMPESLYPRDRYPQGHPDLALSLNNMGALLKAQGSYGEAQGYFERALAMYESLPKGSLPPRPPRPGD
jgi:tetratricopeptide (TPR) repeat protein